jgi:hypothetical protein
MGNKRPNVFGILLKTIKDNILAIALIALAVSFVAINANLFSVRASERLVNATIVAKRVDGSEVTVLSTKEVSFGNNESSKSSIVEGLSSSLTFNPNTSLEYTYSASNISSGVVYIKIDVDRTNMRNIKVEYYKDQSEEAGDLLNDGFFAKLQTGEDLFVRVVISIETPDADAAFDGSIRFGVTD